MIEVVIKYRDTSQLAMGASISLHAYETLGRPDFVFFSSSNAALRVVRTFNHCAKRPANQVSVPDWCLAHIKPVREPVTMAAANALQTIYLHGDIPLPHPATLHGTPIKEGVAHGSWLVTHMYDKNGHRVPPDSEEIWVCSFETSIRLDPALIIEEKAPGVFDEYFKTMVELGFSN